MQTASPNPAPSDDAATAVTLIGCGYVGTLVAQLEQTADRICTAVSHNRLHGAQLAQLGLTVHTADLDNIASLNTLSLDGVDLYYFAPPPATGQRDTRLRNLRTACRHRTHPRRLVLISTSGVYGDCQGDWVDETRPPNPQTDRARRRLDAEHTAQAWAAHDGFPLSILRVPGIYGPDRLPLTRLRRGSPVLNEHESPWSNRIHVDDLARACLAARRCVTGGTFNIADGNPSTMTDYFNQTADALAIPSPPQISLAQAQRQLSPQMCSYLTESKRLDITRLRHVLGVTPVFTDLRRGLADAVRRQTTQRGTP